MLFTKSCVTTAILAIASAPVFAQQPTATPPIHVLSAPAASPTGTFPSQMVVAYGFNQITNQGAGQTVAIIDAYDDPKIASDLHQFDVQFGLPDPPSFQVIYQTGIEPTQDSTGGWELEESLDVEWVHAIAPQANIILVEAQSNQDADLFASVGVAVANGATVVTMSFGATENSSETSYDSTFTAPGVVYFASSGDGGHGVEYPAASPNVVGVGGTTLTIQSDGTYVSETAWSDSGGGVSTVEPEPAFQESAQKLGKRIVPDVSYDANPSTGVPVYDTIPYEGTPGTWYQVGGTSMASPQWAALAAIANSERALLSKATLNSTSSNNFLTTLYGSLDPDLHDITSGRNGFCFLACKTRVGYDAVTGLGTPEANLVIPALVALP